MCGSLHDIDQKKCIHMYSTISSTSGQEISQNKSCFRFCLLVVICTELRAKPFLGQRAIPATWKNLG